MKIFVLISAAIHIAAFFLMAISMEIKPSVMVSQPFHASLASANKDSKRDGKVSTDIGTINDMVRSKAETVNTPQSKEVISEIQAADINEADLSQAQPQVENYYSPTNVELIALPTSNLDSSMFSGQFISGLPIKLRLYINAFGRIVKVDYIDLLEQDLRMANRLEDLLRQITFLPAKRNGASVDSYQDVEFSF